MKSSPPHGHSRLKQAGFRLSLGVGADAYFSTRADGDLRQSKAQLAALLDLRELHTLHQVHSAQVRVVGEEERPRVVAPDEQVRLLGEREQVQRPRAGTGGPAQRLTGDALITDRRLHGVAVYSADCLPIALAGKHTIGAVHAGWRGLAEGVIEAAVRGLRELGEEGELYAVIGPGAGSCCYEVGPEVKRALGLEAEHGRLDLATIASERALAAGVSHLRTLAHCTICDRRFFSHRREGPGCGRQGVIVWRR
jgi:YfiH family protein